MNLDLYTSHKPVIVKSRVANNQLLNGDGGPGDFDSYLKQEFDDNFIFWKTKSISINAQVLETVELVIVRIQHRNVTVVASKRKIKLWNEVRNFKGETKFYLPFEQWTVIEGDKDWIGKIKNDI